MVEGRSDWALEPVYEPLGEADPKRVGGFELLGRLGSGGMGTVYLGLTRKGGCVAVKRVLPQLAGSRRFEGEIRSLYRLPETVTPRVRANDCTAERPWFATDYVPGCDLGRVVGRCGPLPAASLWRLLHVISVHLRAGHEAGVSHRDLTPGNVILTADGARLIDFGIARVAEQVHATATGGLAGTRGFMAPEQRDGGEATDKVDVYALGALVCFAASGSWPGETPDLEPVRRLDRELAAIVELCLAEAPGARPRAADLADRFASRAPATALPWPEAVMHRIAVLRAFADNPPKPPSPPKWRAALPVGSIAVVLLTANAVAVLLPHRSPSLHPPDPAPASTHAAPTRSASRQSSPTPPSPRPSTITTTPPIPATTSATAAATLSPTSTIDPRSYYAIANSGTGHCLGQVYPSAQAGTTLCTTLAPTDGWNYYATRANGTFEMVDKYTGQCLGETSATGGPAVTAQCAGRPGQLWTNGYSSFYGRSFVNTESGQCLVDINVYGFDSIEMQSCDQQRDQLWYNDGTL